jgi:hypothetical protein
MTYFEQKKTNCEEFKESILVILNHPCDVEERRGTQKCSELQGTEVKVQVAEANVNQTLTTCNDWAASGASWA